MINDNIKIEKEKKIKIVKLFEEILNTAKEDNGVYSAEYVEENNEKSYVVIDYNHRTNLIKKVYEIDTSRDSVSALVREIMYQISKIRF